MELTITCHAISLLSLVWILSFSHLTVSEIIRIVLKKTDGVPVKAKMHLVFRQYTNGGSEHTAFDCPAIEKYHMTVTNKRYDKTFIFKQETTADISRIEINGILKCLSFEVIVQERNTIYKWKETKEKKCPGLIESFTNTGGWYTSKVGTQTTQMQKMRQLIYFKSSYNVYNSSVFDANNLDNCGEEVEEVDTPSLTLEEVETNDVKCKAVYDTNFSRCTLSLKISNKQMAVIIFCKDELECTGGNLIIGRGIMQKPLDAICTADCTLEGRQDRKSFNSAQLVISRLITDNIIATTVPKEIEDSTTIMIKCNNTYPPVIQGNSEREESIVSNTKMVSNSVLFFSMGCLLIIMLTLPIIVVLLKKYRRYKPRSQKFEKNALSKDPVIQVLTSTAESRTNSYGRQYNKPIPLVEVQGAAKNNLPIAHTDKNHLPSSSHTSASSWAFFDSENDCIEDGVYDSFNDNTAVEFQYDQEKLHSTSPADKEDTTLKEDYDAYDTLMAMTSTTRGNNKLYSNEEDTILEVDETKMSILNIGIPSNKKIVSMPHTMVLTSVSTEEALRGSVELDDGEDNVGDHNHELYATLNLTFERKKACDNLICDENNEEMECERDANANTKLDDEYVPIYATVIKTRL